MRVFMEVVAVLIVLGLVAMVIYAAFFRSFDGDYDPNE